MHRWGLCSNDLREGQDNTKLAHISILKNKLKNSCCKSVRAAESAERLKDNAIERVKDPGAKTCFLTVKQYTFLVACSELEWNQNPNPQRRTLVGQKNSLQNPVFHSQSCEEVLSSPEIQGSQIHPELRNTDFTTNFWTPPTPTKDFLQQILKLSKSSLAVEVGRKLIGGEAIMKPLLRKSFGPPPHL